MTHTAPCAAVILAAGNSSRLGQPKQTVRLATTTQPETHPAETLLERTLRVAAQAGLAPIYVVTQHPKALEHAAQTLAPNRLICLEHHHTQEGMAASIRKGVTAAQQAPTPAQALILLTCDQPAVTPHHLERLAQGGSRILASTYAGRNGVPAYFPASAFPALLALTGDTGARSLLTHAQAIPLPFGEIDIDTPEDLAHARNVFGP